MRRFGLAILLVAWLALAVWTFSFAFSSGYFEYNLPSRLPPFVTAVFVAVAIPVSGALQWRRALRSRTTALRAWLAHGALTGLLLSLLPLVAGVQRQLPRPFRLSADDAMGVGIDFMILVAVALTSLVAVGVAVAAGRRRPEGSGPG